MIISIKYVIRFAKSEMIYEMPYSRGRVHLCLLQGEIWLMDQRKKV